MKVSSVQLSSDLTKATLVLRPNWLARLFGARELLVQLVYNGPLHDWCSAVTRDPVTRMHHRRLIITALEATPIEKPALATAWYRRQLEPRGPS